MPAKHSPKRTTTRTWALLALLLASGLVWLFNVRSGQIREYREYFFEDHGSIELDWDRIGDGLTEEIIQTRFKQHRVSCYPEEPGFGPTLRRCHADANLVNGIPALYVIFWIEADRAKQIAVVIPWWHHQTGLNSLLASKGKPKLAQPRRIHDVRLFGWQLADQSSLFYNMDRPRFPNELNSVQWYSPTACKGTACIR